MRTLLGYTYIITETDQYQDYMNYIDGTIRVYRSLERIIEIINRYIKEENLEEEIKYTINLNKFITENEGKIFKSKKIADIGDYYDNRAIFIKSVFTETEEEHEDEDSEE